jgi:two-component system sensor histidine kinase UhpB
MANLPSPSVEPNAAPPSDAPLAWVKEVWHGNLFAVPVLYRILIANCVMLVVGAVLGTALAGSLHGANRPPIIGGFTAIGVLLSIVVNFVLLKIAFWPLTRLRDTMRQIEAGDTHLQAPVSGYDPDADELAATFNRMMTTLDDLSKSRAAQILRAQEEERKRIARELHDETSQALTSLLVSMALLEDALHDRPEARQQVSQVRATAHQTLRAIRSMSLDLRPSALDDLGLLPALRGYIKEYQQKTGIDAAFNVTGLRERYASEVETALYRIVQEALANIARHAQATKAVITMSERNDHRAHVVITDNGRGFDSLSQARRPASDGGLGLVGMRERASLLDGTIDIVSHPGKGTTITLDIPLRRAEKAGGHSHDTSSS